MWMGLQVGKIHTIYRYPSGICPGQALRVGILGRGPDQADAGDQQTENAPCLNNESLSFARNGTGDGRAVASPACSHRRLSSACHGLVRLLVTAKVFCWQAER